VNGDRESKDGVSARPEDGPATLGGTLEERVTAYVDGVLDEAERARIETLVAERPDLREQVEFERELRTKLRGLSIPEPRPGFEAQVRGTLRGVHRRPRTYMLLPLAAALFMVLWLRGRPGFVALEVARDHKKCFSLAQLPAKVWSDDPAEIAAWFEKQGTSMPQLPAGAAQLQLVGARYCPLGDRSVPHVYYAGRRHRLSLYVVTGPLRFAGDQDRESLGQHLRFLRTAGIAVALVAEEPEIVEAFAREFQQTLARLESETPSSFR
jgi:anti-sigma factor RsiW